MSAQIISSENGILTVKVSGKLTQPELASVQDEAGKLLAKQQKMGILVIGENFQGWEKSGRWGDLSFQVDNDQYISGMALVGEKKWEDLVLLFTAKGLRKFPIEYFPQHDEAKALAWLRLNQ